MCEQDFKMKTLALSIRYFNYQFKQYYVKYELLYTCTKHFFLNFADVNFVIHLFGTLRG